MSTRHPIRALIIVLSISVVLASTVSANAIYLASQHHTLFRYDPGLGSLETFDMGRRLTGLHYDAQADRVYGTAITGVPGTVSDLVEIENAVTGTPTMTVISNLTNTYGGVTKIGDLFYAYHNNGLELHSIDVSDSGNPVETYIGQGFQDGNDALAYDPGTDTMYTIGKFDEAVYQVDYTTGDATEIGPLGINQAMSVGAEWYAGHMYMAVQNADSTDFEIGQIDVTTGHYKWMYTLSTGTAGFVATGLAIVPEPGAFALILVGALFATRRGR